MIQVSVIMGSSSDFEIMQHAVGVLKEFDIKHETRIISAHRTPDLMFEYAKLTYSRGIKVIIAGAGGAAHLPGMVASKTITPVLGVPIPSKYLHGQDSLLSIVQMPKGIPVGTLAIGEAGAVNAALLAIGILASFDEILAHKLQQFRQNQTQNVIDTILPNE